MKETLRRRITVTSSLNEISRGSEAESKEKLGVWDPMPESTLTPSQGLRIWLSPLGFGSAHLFLEQLLDICLKRTCTVYRLHSPSAILADCSSVKNPPWIAGRNYFFIQSLPNGN
jgi:hypothetical protein